MHVSACLVEIVIQFTAIDAAKNTKPMIQIAVISMLKIEISSILLTEKLVVTLPTFVTSFPSISKSWIPPLNLPINWSFLR